MSDDDDRRDGFASLVGAFFEGGDVRIQLVHRVSPIGHPRRIVGVPYLDFGSGGGHIMLLKRGAYSVIRQIALSQQAAGVLLGALG